MRRPLQKLFWIMAPVLVMWGCSNTNTNPEVPRPHPSNQQWVSQHGDRFIETNGTECRTCHGENLTGGIAIGCGVAGYKLPSGETVLCHGRNDAPDAEVPKTGPFGHSGAEGFMASAPTFHGNFAKGPPHMDPTAPFGFEECTDCHNGDFTGRTIPGPTAGSSITTDNCNTACHSVTAPHSPEAEWVVNHRMTDPANAETCGTCHGPVVGAPNCFTGAFVNCHGAQPANHPTGQPEEGWNGHGAAAMNIWDPTAPSGFISCNGCHGSKFSGDAGNSAPACRSCHGINAPHPDSEEWEETIHTQTNPVNALVCAWCHRKTTYLPPDCFNNSLCHGPK